MGMYPGPNEDALRPWVVYGVGDRSDVGGGLHLDVSLGRLVGVRKISTGNQGTPIQETSQRTEPKPEATLDTRI